MGMGKLQVQTRMDLPIVATTQNIMACRRARMFPCFVMDVDKSNGCDLLIFFKLLQFFYFLK